MLQRLFLVLLIALSPATAIATAATTVPGDPKAGDNAPAARDAMQAFDRLKGLVGDWRGRFEDGREHQVRYRLSALDTVLVETWALAPGRESITLYHLDGDDLLATHYCPQGNQPRLRLVSGNRAGRLSFQFKDGSNLAVPGRSHQHSMWIEINADGSYSRSETYIENGSEAAADIDGGTAIVYTRIDSALSR